MATLSDKVSIPLTRRALLVSGAAVGAAPLLAATGASAGPKISQNVVGYSEVVRGSHNCGNCALFLAPSSCEQVAGLISENGNCKVWLPKIG
jgi:hypothetical protein